MLSTSALTWAAAQERVPIYELLRGLSPTDEAKIEAAYAEWRRRAAAGERRHKVDWRSFPLSAEQEAEVVTAVPEPAPIPAPASIEDVEADEADESADDAPWEENDDPDVADAVAEILAVETSEPEYVSLDDFNLEPSDAEMKAMKKAMADDLTSAGEEEEQTEVEVLEETLPTEVEEAVPADVEEVVETSEEAPPTENEQVDAPIEQRISKLGKDAAPSVYENILAGMAGDVDALKAVTEAVIKDHTKRHRGTAPQRAFLTWLNER